MRWEQQNKFGWVLSVIGFYRTYWLLLHPLTTACWWINQGEAAQQLPFSAQPRLPGRCTKPPREMRPRAASSTAGLVMVARGEIAASCANGLSTTEAIDGELRMEYVRRWAVVLGKRLAKKKCRCGYISKTYKHTCIRIKGYGFSSLQGYFLIVCMPSKQLLKK